MTLKELSQLYYLNKEIAQDKQKLLQFEEIATNTAAKITGLPHVGGISDKTAIAAEIADLKTSIEARIQLSMVEYNRLNRYIQSVDDSLIRQIISLRFVDGLKWQQVAVSIGGNNNEDSLRMLLNRFLRK